MSTFGDLERVRRRPRVWSRHGFTLIELLVVIAIIALIISILLPALNNAKNEGTKAQCVSSLREILKATAMYDSDNADAQGTLPWYQIPVHPGYGVNSVFPYVFGGFRSPNPAPNQSFTRDADTYPAQIRPLNKYVDRTAIANTTTPYERGKDIIKLFICPSDRTASLTMLGGDPTNAPNLDEEAQASWQSNGNSYSFNTRWYQGYFQNADFSSNVFNEDQKKQADATMARKMVGDGASRFIQWVEVGFYSAAHSANLTIQSSNAPPQRMGWHRKFSSWSVGFADGHALHGYYNTRLVFGGLDGTIWVPNYMPVTTP